MLKKILVAEDNKGLQLLYSKLLKNNGHDVYLASNGAEAFTLLVTEDDIDIALIDIMMPKLNGIEFVKRAKTMIQEKNVKICMLSALSDISKVEECLRAGADDYIVKVGDGELLVNKVNFLLGYVPKYEYSKIECKHPQKFKIIGRDKLENNFRSGALELEVTLIQIHEDYFVFNTEVEVKNGDRIIVDRGEIKKMMEIEQDISARVFRVYRESKVYTVCANYIGLTEDQMKTLRSKTVRGGGVHGAF